MRKLPLGLIGLLPWSVAGGQNWLPSVVVSASANALKPADRHVNGGDTAGLTADADGVFHLLWIDNRTGVHQVWTTTVAVRGKPARPIRP